MYSVLVESFEEGYAPPASPVLDVQYVGPSADADSPALVYFRIGEIDEFNDGATQGHTFTSEGQQIGVTVDDLVNALVTVGALRPVEPAPEPAVIALVDVPLYD